MLLAVGVHFVCLANGVGQNLLLHKAVSCVVYRDIIRDKLLLLITCCYLLCSSVGNSRLAFTLIDDIYHMILCIVR